MIDPNAPLEGADEPELPFNGEPPDDDLAELDEATPDTGEYLDGDQDVTA